MTIQAVHTQGAYQAALKRVSALVDLDPQPGTAWGDELEVSGTLVQVYEAEHFGCMPNARAR
jgi:HTH-type transcriptional regulator / antitoxin HigA